ncbi:MAG: hypothetical protein WC604_04430 [Candidatus Gracilibacteria bacterium]
MENSPQVLLCIPDPNIRKNLASQIIPPETSAEILEAPDLSTALNLAQEDTNHRIKVVIIGLFEEIEDMLVIIMAIRLDINTAVKTILIYDSTQRSERENKTTKEYLDEVDDETIDTVAKTVDFTLPYPINIPEMRSIIAALLTAQP